MWEKLDACLRQASFFYHLNSIPMKVQGQGGGGGVLKQEGRWLLRGGGTRELFLIFLWAFLKINQIIFIDLSGVEALSPSKILNLECSFIQPVNLNPRG